MFINEFDCPKSVDLFPTNQQNQIITKNPSSAIIKVTETIVCNQLRKYFAKSNIIYNRL